MSSSSDTIIETTVVMDHASVNVLLSKGTDDNEPKMGTENQKIPFIGNNSIQQYKPHYLTLSDGIFKEMLSNAVQDGDTVVRCLNTDEKLQMLRQMTEITNSLHYVDLQQHLWQAYYDIGINENLWASSATNSSTSAAYPTYYFPKRLVEKRRQTLVRQKQRTIHKLERCLVILQQKALSWQPSIDLDLLSRAVTECVKKGQRRLKEEFLYRIDITQLNINERRSKKTFYEIEPNQEQVCFGRKRERKERESLSMLIRYFRYA